MIFCQKYALYKAISHIGEGIMSKNDKKNMTKWNRAAVAVNEAGTKVEFVGGVNRDRIGGNCMVI